jgi:uncharacterized membrane protein
LEPQFNAQPRLVSVDLVRVFAMALMVQGHTLDVLLTPQIQSAPWYNFWMFCRGFTAPTFMMLAGFSFALATIKRWHDHIVPGPAVWKRLRRFAFFVLLGYSMRIPVHSIRDYRWITPEGWQQFFQMDVLQTIGLTLIALELMIMAFKNKKAFAIASAAMAMLIAFGAPLAWNSVMFNSLPLGLRSALLGTTGSNFPLLPWSAYIFLGATLGTAYATKGEWSPKVLRNAVPFGLLLILAGVRLEGVSHWLYGDANFWPTTPHLFLTRVGFVTTLIGLASMVESWIPIKASTARSLAEESLVVYFVHVSLLYGSIWNTGLKHYVGGTMGFAHAYLYVIAMVSLMLMMAFYWNRAKKSHPMHSFAFRTAIFAAAAFAVA